MAEHGIDFLVRRKDSAEQFSPAVARVTIDVLCGTYIESCAEPSTPPRACLPCHTHFGLRGLGGEITKCLKTGDVSVIFIGQMIGGQRDEDLEWIFVS